MADIQETEVKKLEPLLKDDQEISISMITTPMPQAPRKRRRGLIFVISVIVLIALIGGGLALVVASRKQGVVYTQRAVTQGNVETTVSSTGPLAPKSEVNLSFQASGQVNSIQVAIGQQVKSGQVLATLNATTLQDQVNQAQQKLDAANLAYDDAYNNGASQTALDQDYESIQSAQLSLQAAQHQLAGATLSAPISGTVAAINGAVGDSASSGSNASAFIVLTDTSGFTITANVDEADIVQVATNQAATFTVSAYPGRTFRATVTSIETVGTTSSNVVNYPVQLVVDMTGVAQSVHLYTGMTATVNIVTASASNVLLVPVAALTFYSQALSSGELSRADITTFLRNAAGRGQNGQNGSGTTGSTTSRGIVLKLINGKLTPVLVTTGLTNGTFTEIVSGLNQGDMVIVGQTGGSTTSASSSSLTGGFGGNFGGGRSGTGGGGTGRGTGGSGSNK